MNQLIAAALLAIFVAGCMSASTSSTPTHRWASTDAANEIQYRNDHARCQAEANIGAGDNAFDAASPGFAAYKQCMNSRGYVLTAYHQ